MPKRNGPLRTRNGIAVWIVRRPAQHLVDPLNEPFGDDVLELFRFVVHLVPTHPHHLHQEQLHESMPPEDQTGQLLPCGRKANARVRLVFDQS